MNDYINQNLEKYINDTLILNQTIMKVDSQTFLHSKTEGPSQNIHNSGYPQKTKSKDYLKANNENIANF